MSQTNLLARDYIIPAPEVRNNVIELVDREKIKNKLINILNIDVNKDNYRELYDSLSSMNAIVNNNVDNLSDGHHIEDYVIQKTVKNIDGIAGFDNSHISYLYFFKMGQLFNYQFKNHLKKTDLKNELIDREFERKVTTNFQDIKKVELKSDMHQIIQQLVDIIENIDQEYKNMNYTTPEELLTLSTSMKRMYLLSTQGLDIPFSGTYKYKRIESSVWSNTERKAKIDSGNTLYLIEAKKKLTFWMLGSLLNTLTTNQIEEYINSEQL